MPGFSTRAIHTLTDLPHGAVAPPIHLSSTFAQPADGAAREYVYQRGSNPTRTDLETVLAALERARHGFAFGSGMAATAAVLGLLSQGDRVVFSASLYGGTYRFIDKEFPKRGLRHEFVDDLNALDEAAYQGAAMVFLETPTNPTLRVVDIAAVARRAHAVGATVVVDNTFLSPYLQRPLELGADLVIQSATKFLAGHSDLLAGAVTTNNDELAEGIRLAQKVSGGMLSPIDSYRLLQDVKTLALRLDRQVATATAVIGALQDHEGVDRLFYPGSFSAEEAAIQRGQADGIGAVISLELARDRNPQRFLEALELFEFAVSLGGVESLVCRPATMTHEAFSPEDQLAAGITPRLLRLAIGIEEQEDLLADLAGALEAARV